MIRSSLGRYTKVTKVNLWGRVHEDKLDATFGSLTLGIHFQTMLDAVKLPDSYETMDSVDQKRFDEAFKTVIDCDTTETYLLGEKFDAEIDNERVFGRVYETAKFRRWWAIGVNERKKRYARRAQSKAKKAQGKEKAKVSPDETPDEKPDEIPERWDADADAGAAVQQAVPERSPTQPAVTVAQPFSCLDDEYY